MGVSIQNMVLSDHDVEIQVLDQCMTDFQKVSARRGGGSSVTFATQIDLDHSSVLTGAARMQKMAFIVWLDRDKAQKLLDAKTPKGMPPEHEAPLRSLMLALQHVFSTGAANSMLWGVDLNIPLDNLLELFKEQP